MVITIRADNAMQSTHGFVHSSAHVCQLFVALFNIYPSLHFTIPLWWGGSHCHWIGHRWFVGVRWRVSVHWLCVHSVTWCWSAETQDQVRPRPQSFDISCEMSPIGWVEWPSTLMMVDCTCQVYTKVTFPSCKPSKDKLGFSMGHQSHLALRLATQCKLMAYIDGQCRPHRTSPGVHLAM